MKLRRLMVFALGFSLLPLGCGELDLDQLQEDLSDMFGNFDTSDEIDAYFGESSTFAALEQDENEGETDPPDTDDENEPPETENSNTAISIIATWGYKIRAPDETDITTTTWDPTITTSCGKVGLKKLIRFEDDDEVVSPRDSDQSISFISSTRPHRDGVLIVLGFDEADACDTSGTLSISSAALESTLTLDIADLLDYHSKWDVEGNNNLNVVAQKIESDCNKGYLFGRWQDNAESPQSSDDVEATDTNDPDEKAFGGFRGRAIDLLGERVGHLKGRWGKAKKGKHQGKNVIFGKFIDTEGKFKALFAGKYGMGHAKGAWYKKRSFNDAKGTFHFRYKRSTNSDRDSGLFRGRWADSACAHKPKGEKLKDKDD